MLCTEKALARSLISHLRRDPENGGYSQCDWNKQLINRVNELMSETGNRIILESDGSLSTVRQEVYGS